MRWLIDYIPSCFCEHEWELLNKAIVYKEYTNWFKGTNESCEIGKRWTYRCKKCGYCKTYHDYE